MFLCSLIFNFLFAIVTLLVTIIFSPFLFFKARPLYWAGYVWSKLSLFLLKLICNIDFIVKGRENLPNKPFVIASKHQSMLETIIFWQIFYIPSFVLKKELLSIAFFGRYLKAMKMIAIDRKDGFNAIKEVAKQAQEHASNGRYIIIFPEGTRTKYGKRTEKYLPGIYMLYHSINLPIVPVALNSGKFWPRKRSHSKKPGTITIEILPAIQQGLKRQDFMLQINDVIESAAEKL